MSLADQVLAVNDDLPIRTNKPVHSGKVRSVYLSLIHISEPTRR